MAVLLISEKRVKETTSISDNVAGKYIQPSIVEAQEQGFRHIVGEALYRRIVELVESRQIELPENGQYKALLDEAQYYLAYKTVMELCMRVSYKIGNFGVAKSSDENLQVASFEEIVSQRDYYQCKVDSYCYDLQIWLLCHKAAFPDLSDCDCNRIKSNIYSAASCGVFLGGARGKIIRR